VPDLKEELWELAGKAARQARPLPVADVIRQGERRSRHAITRWSMGRARPAGLATPAPPARRWPGWVAPLAAASGVILAVGLAVTLGSHVHLGGHAGRVNDGRAETAYVLSGFQGTVTPISPVTGMLGKPVTVGPAGYWAGHGKRRFQVSRIVQDLILPGGKTNYARYFNGHGPDATQALRRTSLVTGAAGQPIQLGRGAQQMVITPDGRTAYVAYMNAGGTVSTLRAVSLVTGTVGKAILRAPEASTPWMTAFMTPDGRTVYVPYLHQGTVMPISTATNTPGRPIPVPGAMTVVFARDGRTAFVIGKGTVTPISTATNAPGKTISIGRRADLLTFAPDGKTVYVIDLAPSVTPISTRTGRAGRPIPLNIAGGFADMEITPDGKTLYVTGLKDNEVHPISLATGTAGKPLNVTGTVLNMVLTPDGRTAYTFSGMAGAKQVVTPISTGTSTPGKPIRTARGTEVIVPGDQNPP
jgi:DNA-binding beta-propeller fold protein YncE